MTNRVTLDELISGYAAGRLPDAVNFIVANHLELSAASVQLAASCNCVGGALIDALPESRVRSDLLDDILKATEEEIAVETKSSNSSANADLPSLLRKHLDGPVEQLDWREFSGIGEYDLLHCDRDGYHIKLVKVRAGRAVPQHTHDGDELTLILRGAFDDVTGRYERGDLAIANHEVDHRPIADSQVDCLCLAVSNAPIRLSGSLTRYLNPFLRF